MSITDSMPSSIFYAVDTTADQALQGIDLRNVNILVTGGSAGIGIETVRSLYLVGANVYATARDLKKGASVLSEIRESALKTHPGVSFGKLEVLHVNLESLESVSSLTSSYINLNIPLHILINNAGLVSTSYKKTIDNFELNFGVNHLSHFLLTLLLTPLLSKSSSTAPNKKSRVINVASHAHTFTKEIDYTKIYFPNTNTPLPSSTDDNLQPYAISKLANMLFTREYARLYSNNKYNIDTYSLHPGVIKTSINANHSKMDEMMKDKYNKTVQQGASTTVWAATNTSVLSSDKSGSYLDNCNLSNIETDSAKSEEDAYKLWIKSLEFVGIHKLPLLPENESVNYIQSITRVAA